MPWLLRGHPAGYQEDLLTFSESTAAASKGSANALAAAAQDASPIVNLERGNYELQQRGYVRHLVFVSHNLKGNDRELVDQICRQCRDWGIDFFEYEDCGRSGEDWKKKLGISLDSMTHFVALLSPTYEHSTMCVHERDRTMNRKNAGEVTILPFRVLDRASPSVDLQCGENQTHQPLPSSETPAENARSVVDNILLRCLSGEVERSAASLVHLLANRGGQKGGAKRGQSFI